MKKDYEYEDKFCYICKEVFDQDNFQFIDLCNKCYDKIYPSRWLPELRQFWREKIIPKFPRKDGESNQDWRRRVGEHFQEKYKGYKK
jgi:hypothetical protein